MVDMPGSYRLDRLALQIVTCDTGSHTFQIAQGTGVQTQSRPQFVFFKSFRVQRKNILKNTEFERYKAGSKKRRMQRKQFLQGWMNFTALGGRFFSRRSASLCFSVF